MKLIYFKLKGRNRFYSKPNFAYTDNTLFTSIQSTTTDNLTDFGYKVSNAGFSVGTEFEQYENLFFSPEVNLSLEDLETNTKASNNLKKQAGNYEDFYFNYGLNFFTFVLATLLMKLSTYLIYSLSGKLYYIKA